MIQSRRFYIIGAVTFLALLLVLGSTFLRNNGRIGAVVKHFTEDGDPAGDEWDKIDTPPSSQNGGTVDWSKYAYVQYATNAPYLCNSVMLFERLHALNCKADRLLMYPSQFSPDADNSEAALLRKARDDYNVILKPIEVQRRPSRDRELQRPVTFSRRDLLTSKQPRGPRVTQSFLRSTRRNIKQSFISIPTRQSCRIWMNCSS